MDARGAGTDVCVGGIAAHGTGFTIREGQVTEFDVKLQRGIRVPIDVIVPSAEVKQISFYLHRDGTRVLGESIRRNNGDEPFHTELSLAPGTYSALGRGTGFSGTAKLVVTAESVNATAQLTLRSR